MINAYCFGNPKKELKQRSSSSSGTSDEEESGSRRGRRRRERDQRVTGDGEMHREQSATEEWGGNEMWPRIEGTLVKRAIKSGMNWKRRHFVLKNGVLTYYKQKNGSIRGQIHVT